MPALKKLIHAHFGNRAYLIKLDSTLRQIEVACFWARQDKQIQGPDRAILQRVATRFEQLRAEEVSFHALQVLRDYYQGKLSSTEKEVQQLLQDPGEFGLSVHQLLGLDTGLGTQDLLATARTRANYWRTRTIDPGASRETIVAAEVLANAYDRLLYQIMAEML